MVLFSHPSRCASLGEPELRLADLRVFGTRGTGVAGPGRASLGTRGSIWSQSQRCLPACWSDEEQCCRLSTCILEFALSQLLRRKLIAYLINFTFYSLFNYYQMTQQIRKCKNNLSLRLPAPGRSQLKGFFFFFSFIFHIKPDKLRLRFQMKRYCGVRV